MIYIMFDDLPTGLRQLAYSHRRLDAGAYLFRQDEAVRWLHLVEQGTIHLVRHQVSGFALILQRAGPGAVVAEASLSSDRYHCDAIAARPALVRAVEAATVRERLARDREFAESWAAFLAREVQRARLRAELLSLRTVSARLNAWLACHDGRLPPKGDWKDMAGELGVSPEALYRELAKRRVGTPGV
ncbi:MAG: Crp/Fnr family transcriptional regulator [Alphaproteobacteria bacterium]